MVGLEELMKTIGSFRHVSPVQMFHGREVTKSLISTEGHRSIQSKTKRVNAPFKKQQNKLILVSFHRR